MTLDDLEDLKRKVESIRQSRDRAAGRLSQVERQILKETGCKTIKEAKSLLAELKAKEKDCLTAYTSERRKFDQRWESRLGGRGES